MKKLSPRPQTQTVKPSKKLFGVSADQLKAVYGGEGAVANNK
jgi:hypothetical protein